MIFISAGHYQEKPGSAYNGFIEWVEAMRWRNILVDLLGVEQSMSVPSSTLPDKINFINRMCDIMGGPHLAVEIHFNDAIDSEGRHIGRGSETLYYPGSKTGHRNALIMQDHLKNVYGPDRGAREGWYRMDKTRGPDYFLAKTKCSALIVEPEFVVNRDKIEEGQVAGCHVIAQAILEITQEMKNESNH